MSNVILTSGIAELHLMGWKEMRFVFLKRTNVYHFLFINTINQAGERIGEETADAWEKGHNIYNSVNETFKMGKLKQSSSKKDICIA